MILRLRSRDIRIRYLIYGLAAAGFLYFCYLTRPDEPDLFLTRLNQISLGVEQRVTWWNWEDTAEEQWCADPPVEASSSKKPIPDVVHYIYFSPNDDPNPADLTFRSFLSIKATLLRLRPSEVKIHTTNPMNPTNVWWQQLAPHVTIVPHNRSALVGPLGRPYTDFGVSHQSDFLRLDLMYHEGGMYFDTDIYPARPFTALRRSSRDAVLGHEGGNRYGFGSGVILARPGSEFIGKWRAKFEDGSYNPWVWNYHAIRVPKLLQIRFPDLVCPLSPAAFHWPTWATKHHHYMEDELTTREAEEFKMQLEELDGLMHIGQWALHLHPKVAPTLESVMTVDSRFNIFVRDLVDAPLA